MTIDGFTIYDFSVGSGSAVFVYVNYSVFVIEEEGGDVLFRGVLDGQGEDACGEIMDIDGQRFKRGGITTLLEEHLAAFVADEDLV